MMKTIIIPCKKTITIAIIPCKKMMVVSNFLILWVKYAIIFIGDKKCLKEKLLIHWWNGKIKKIK